jgi:PAS domain S-box-containing protein
MGQDMDGDTNIFQLILDKTGEEFYLVRRDGTLAYVNEAAAKSLGYTVKELSSMRVPDFDPLFGPRFRKHFNKLKERDLPAFETEHIAKGGQRIIKEIKSVYLKIDKEEFVGAFARDITARIKAEETIKQLAHFPDENPNPIIRVNRDGVILYANEASTPLINSWGASMGELLPDEIFQLVINTILLGSIKELEQTCGDRILLLKLAPISDGNFVNIYGLDITDHKHAAEALQKSEERYRSLVENLKEEYFFYSHDTNGIFNYISPSITNILGYSQKEFLAHYTEYLTDDPINDEVVQHSDLSIQGIEQPSYEVEIYHKDGSIKRLEVVEVPLLSPENKVIAVEGIAHDITERRKVFIEMRRKTRELGEVNAAMRVLLRQSSESKKELKGKVLENLKDLVMPYLDELEIQLAGKRSKTLVNVIKSNLEHITSPFSQRLSLGYPRLTPREIQIADLVRNGRTNKEIGELLNISSRTVEAYRDKLRTKLKIKKKKVNLRSYLLSQT